MPERLQSPLPTFICTDDGENINLWPEAAPASYSIGNQIGRARAEELIDIIRRTQSPALLGHVFAAIAKKGTIGGVEIGFFHSMSLELMNPEKITEFVAVPPERRFRVGLKVGHLAVVEPDVVAA